MNVRKFEHLLAVLETRSLRAAAEAVHLSQPALSRSLASLEEELGITLLDREYGTVRATAYSEPVLNHIKRIAEETRALKDSVRRLKGLEEGEIRVGFGSFAAAIAVRAVGSELIRRYPKLALRVELAHSTLLLELLQDGRLDVVICDSRYVMQDMEFATIELPKQVSALVTSKNHPLQRRGKVALDELKGYPIGSPTLPAEHIASFEAHGFTGTPTVTCNEMHVLLELAANTDLIAIVPKLVVDRGALPTDLGALAVKLPFEVFGLPTILTRRRDLGPAARLLVDLVRQHFTSPTKSPR